MKPSSEMSKWKIIVGIILFFGLLELFKEFLLFPFIEPFLKTRFEIGTSELISETFEYLVILLLLVVFVRYFIFQQINKSSKTLHQLVSESENSKKALQAEIEKKRKKEFELLQEKDFTDTVISAMTGLFFVYDERRNLVRWNKNHEILTGYSGEELKQKAVLDWFEGRDKDTITSAIDIIFDKGEVIVEANLINNDGEAIPYLFSAKRIKLNERAYFAGVGLDLSIRKEAEKERNRLATAIEQLDEMVMITDQDGIIQYVNPSFCSVTGYSSEEVTGRKSSILKSGKQTIHFYDELWNTINSGEIWRGQFVNRNKNGNLYTESATITPLLDSEGNIANFVAVKRDITQEIKIEEQLRQSQKMESIGALAAGIAHDFNNILSVIFGHTQLSLETVQDKPDIKQSLQQVLNAANRAKDLVGQILAFSRPVDLNQKEIRTTPIVKEVCKFIRSSLPTTIEVRQQITAKNDWIKADPTQLHQVLMNLCTNAGQAMKKHGGILEVHLEEYFHGGDVEEDSLKWKAGSYLQLTVKDTGCGISADNIERIFDPYFTTKEKGEGTGLGLAVVHGIVQSFKGTISVDSEVGKGTVVKVFFPLIKKGEKTVAKEVEESLLGGKEHILFVDDETEVVNVNRFLIEDLGYHFTGFTSSIECLEAFKTTPDEFDLVITDKTMPELTGEELSEQIIAIRSDIPIILCTGYNDMIDHVQAKKIGIQSFMLKPILKEDMAEEIRKVLDN